MKVPFAGGTARWSALVAMLFPDCTLEQSSRCNDRMAWRFSGSETVIGPVPWVRRRLASAHLGTFLPVRNPASVAAYVEPAIDKRVFIVGAASNNPFLTKFDGSVSCAPAHTQATRQTAKLPCRQLAAVLTRRGQITGEASTLLAHSKAVGIL
jgi:hypothetical protein